MTAREDLVVYLRHHLLMQLAVDLRCSKVTRGDCAGTVAVRILAETAKVGRFCAVWVEMRALFLPWTKLALMFCTYI
jgi:hypothetical protein